MTEYETPEFTRGYRQAVEDMLRDDDALYTRRIRLMRNAPDLYTEVHPKPRFEWRNG